jgi:SAM-dependent methyltransferase
LQHFLPLGVPVTGIEPAANVAEVARKKNIPTLVEFFGLKLAQQLASEGKTADLIIGNNVLAQVPDLNDFTAGMAHLLAPQGVVTLEFPHLEKLINENQFDTIYHEHFSYLSLLAVERVLDANGLRPFDVELLPSHGGSLRLFCCHVGSRRSETGALQALRAREAAASLGAIETYLDFTPKVEAVRDSFRAFLGAAKAQGRRIAAYGAAAKGNTFLNYCAATADEIVAAFDANPAKQGRFLPGTHAPILAPDQVRKVRPDYLLILPWNLKAEIMGQLAYIAEWGGRFVVASPRTEVVG